MKATTDIAITFDIERDETIEAVMPKIVDIFDRQDAVGTWFIKHDFTGEFTDHTGYVLDRFPSVVENLSQVGEIGTHIHFRDEFGTFSMAPSLQRELLETATADFRDVGYEINSFRGGNLCIDATTLRILADLDYNVDSSALPGHYRELPDGIAVNHRGTPGHQPYVPAGDAHTDVGNLDLLEVPVSGLFPFDASSFQRPLTGVYTKLEGVPVFHHLSIPLFRIWSALSGAPVVLLFHDHEFSVDDGSLEALETFLRWGKSQSNVQFVTMREIEASFRTAE